MKYFTIGAMKRSKKQFISLHKQRRDAYITSPIYASLLYLLKDSIESSCQNILNFQRSYNVAYR